MRTRLAALALSFGIGGSAAACELALVLAVDVSGSVSPEEYQIQMDGLATALRSKVISSALVKAKARVTLIQWTGGARQAVAIPWQSLQTLKDVDELALRIAAEPRIWRNYSTAIGEALEFSMQQFSSATGCRRKVIDVSGDGVSNEGIAPSRLHGDLQALGIIVNALVIENEEDGIGLTAYFRQNVIVGGAAFAMTANGFADYPDKIRRKLERETSKQFAALIDQTAIRRHPANR